MFRRVKVIVIITNIIVKIALVKIIVNDVIITITNEELDNSIINYLMKIKVVYMKVEICYLMKIIIRMKFCYMMKMIIKMEFNYLMKMIM